MDQDLVKEMARASDMSEDEVIKVLQSADASTLAQLSHEHKLKIVKKNDTIVISKQLEASGIYAPAP